MRLSLVILLALLVVSSGCARPRGLVRIVADECNTLGCDLQCGMPCQKCALGHRLDKLKHAKQQRPPIELPPEDMPDFPRFHPVPVQPVFSIRDKNGFPQYAALPHGPTSSLVEEIGEGTLTLPDPASGAQYTKPRGARAQTASWIFTPPRAEPQGIVPPRPPRPSFAEESPRAPATVR